MKRVAIIRKKDLKALGNEELKEKERQLRAELMRESASVAYGSKAENPGRIGETRRTIARIETILRERIKTQ